MNDAPEPIQRLQDGSIDWAYYNQASGKFISYTYTWTFMLPLTRPITPEDMRAFIEKGLGEIKERWARELLEALKRDGLLGFEIKQNGHPS